MSATMTVIVCEDCGIELSDPEERHTRMCTDCLCNWYAALPRTMALEAPAVCPECLGTGEIRDEGDVLACECVVRAAVAR